MGRESLSAAARRAVRLTERFRAYAAHPDPQTAVCNSIALLVASSQPLYPFYIHWFVGGDAWTGCLTFLSTPFFLAVPWIARRSSLGGRAALVLAGVGNTIVSTKAFGEASGVELFLISCALIALLAFRWSERAVMLALVVLCGAVFAGLHGRYGAPVGEFSPTEYVNFFRMNASSATALSAIVTFSFANARGWLRWRAR